MALGHQPLFELFDLNPQSPPCPYVTSPDSLWLLFSTDLVPAEPFTLVRFRELAEAHRLIQHRRTHDTEELISSQSIPILWNQVWKRRHALLLVFTTLCAAALPLLTCLARTASSRNGAHRNQDRDARHVCPAGMARLMFRMNHRRSSWMCPGTGASMKLH